VAAVVKTNDAVQFRESVTKHKNRIRQAIEKIFRSAERDELNDANLNALKRSMKEEVNKVLRKSYVDEIVVYDFSMIEQ
jgi:flagellar basal body-associated protein FliL